MVNKKAKLVWNGKGYFEDDLIHICKKESKFLGGEFLEYRLNRDFNRIVVKIKKNGEIELFQIPFDALKLYNVGEDRSKPVLTINKKGGVKKVYTADDIIAIGSSIALLWGGKCMNYNIDKKAGVITFGCVENGESFSTSMAFYELDNEEYNKYGTILKK